MQQAAAAAAAHAAMPPTNSSKMDGSLSSLPALPSSGSSSSSAGYSRPRQTCGRRDLTLKQLAIREWLEGKIPHSHVARKYNVHVRLLRKWVDQKDAILSQIPDGPPAPGVLPLGVVFNGATGAHSSGASEMGGGASHLPAKRDRHNKITSQQQQQMHKQQQQQQQLNRHANLNNKEKKMHAKAQAAFLEDIASTMEKRGVHYNSKKGSWEACACFKGRTFRKYFAVSRFGADKAYRLACLCRRRWVQFLREGLCDQIAQDTENSAKSTEFLVKVFDQINFGELDVGSDEDFCLREGPIAPGQDQNLPQPNKNSAQYDELQFSYQQQQQQQQTDTHGKRASKPEQAWKEQPTAGGTQDPLPHVEGVTFDRQHRGWRSAIQIGSSSFRKVFSVDAFGSEKAHRLAILCRCRWEQFHRSSAVENIRGDCENFDKCVGVLLSIYDQVDFHDLLRHRNELRKKEHQPASTTAGDDRSRIGELAKRARMLLSCDQKRLVSLIELRKVDPLMNTTALKIGDYRKAKPEILIPILSTIIRDAEIVAKHAERTPVGDRVAELARRYSAVDVRRQGPPSPAAKKARTDPQAVAL
eukprot:GHVT01058522.1.p1 GENE.GHVT01058522.1~~GHVT01058522.1.p1  ORF type:complete len:677 (-),score=201.48 GHVT01058522.1:263-2017(-)